MPLLAAFQSAAIHIEENQILLTLPLNMSRYWHLVLCVCLQEFRLTSLFLIDQLWTDWKVFWSRYKIFCDTLACVGRRSSSANCGLEQLLHRLSVCVGIIQKICPLASVASFADIVIIFSETIKHSGSKEMISFGTKSVKKH